MEDSDLAKGTELLRSDPDFRPDFDQLVDLSGATGEMLSSEAVRGLARERPLFASGARRAIVVGGDLGFGLARMFQTLRTDAAGDS